MAPALSVICGLLFLLAVFLIKREWFSRDRNRLDALQDYEDEHKDPRTLPEEEIDWTTATSVLDNVRSRLGQSGFLTEADRRRARLISIGIIGSGIAIGVWFGISEGDPMSLFIGAFAGGYFGLVCWILFLNNRRADYLRRVRFHTPLTLEKLILLVESGLGLLPAIQHVVAVERRRESMSPVSRVLCYVYELSAAGMPFGTALETVADAVDIKELRHVLLHLDISGSEGGELVPSLRSLSDHAALEWRISVEQRVKRLENSVVFPVFISVMGLMALTAAVPIVPLLEFMQGKQSSPNVGEAVR